jgi:hypothetical protein
MNRFQPALLGGLFIGVLSSLPVVGLANCCCLWVVTGGVVTAYLLQQQTSGPIAASDAALQGLLAGALGAALYLVVFSLVLSTDAGLELRERFRAVLDSNPEIPVEVRDRVLGVVAGQLFLALIWVVMAGTYAVVSMLGALLGAAFFRKRVLPPPST